MDIKLCTKKIASKRDVNKTVKKITEIQNKEKKAGKRLYRIQMAKRQLEDIQATNSNIIEELEDDANTDDDDDIKDDILTDKRIEYMPDVP
jgi:hypothetical protein